MTKARTRRLRNESLRPGTAALAVGHALPGPVGDGGPLWPVPGRRLPGRGRTGGERDGGCHPPRLPPGVLHPAPQWVGWWRRGGVSIGELLRSRPVSQRWGKLLLERLDAVAVIYRLACAVNQVFRPWSSAGIEPCLWTPPSRYPTGGSGDSSPGPHHRPQRLRQLVERAGLLGWARVARSGDELDFAFQPR